MGEDEPTLAPKPHRRTFSAEYKLSIVEQYDACVGDGDKGALLRREGLYSSNREIAQALFVTSKTVETTFPASTPSLACPPAWLSPYPGHR